MGIPFCLSLYSDARKTVAKQQPLHAPRAIEKGTKGANCPRGWMSRGPHKVKVSFTIK